MAEAELVVKSSPIVFPMRTLAIGCGQCPWLGIGEDHPSPSPEVTIVIIIIIVIIVIIS